jgi:hypothetical protein
MEKYNCNDYCMNLLLSNSCQNPSEIEGYSEMRIERKRKILRSIRFLMRF